MREMKIDADCGEKRLSGGPLLSQRNG